MIVLKENKPYFTKNRHCKRIIRAFKESDSDILTTLEIYSLLLDQTNAAGGRLVTHPSMPQVTNNLCKFPFFKKVGIVMGMSKVGNRMKVARWQLTELGEEE